MSYCDIDTAGNVLCTYTGTDEIKAEKTIVPLGKAVFYAFLPAGFPHSVTEDYLAYQTYDSLQAFSSSIASLLASRAVLEGLGVGDAQQSPTAALVLKIIQDTFSRMATILFAHRMGQAIEPECKTYRFMADLFNDSALLLDLLTPVLPFFPKLFIMVASSILRALCGIAASASKASLSAHFARTGNLAELNAKEASQETVISLLGMLAGTAVVHLVEDKTTVWYCMVVLVLVHLYMNYRGVRCVQMVTLNRQRATLVFREWLESGLVLAPAEVSRREGVLQGNRGLLTSKSGVYRGFCEFCSYGDVMRWRPWGGITTASSGGGGARVQRYLFETDAYFMGLWHWPGSDQFHIRIAMREGTDLATGPLLAWFDAVTHAYHFDSALKDGLGSHYENEGPLGYVSPEAKKTVLAALRTAGWDVDHGQLETHSPIRVRMGGSVSFGEKPQGQIAKKD